jgi:hypothetical protein
VPIATASERPDLLSPAWERTRDTMPEYNNHGDVLNEYWPRLTEELPEFQFHLVTDEDEILARARSIPLSWNGTIADLPSGIDGAIQRGFEGGRANVLCALVIMVPRDLQGWGVSAEAVKGMASIARLHGLESLIAPVRPSRKDRYPLVEIERYARWRRRHERANVGRRAPARAGASASVGAPPPPSSPSHLREKYCAAASPPAALNNRGDTTARGRRRRRLLDSVLDAAHSAGMRELSGDLSFLPFLPPGAETARIVEAEEPTEPDKALENGAYAAFDAARRGIDQFVELTTVSYRLAQQLLFETPKENLPTSDTREPEPEKWSYSEADARPHLEVTAGWLRYDEMAQHLNIEAPEAERRANAGEFGTIRKHPSDDADVVLWPLESDRPPDFEELEPGYYTVALTHYTVAAAAPEPSFDLTDPEQLESARTHYLALAHSQGDPSVITEKSLSVVYRSGLLLYWTAFEAFIRRTVEDLITKHPGALVASAGEDARLTYQELVDMSTGLSSIEDLKARLIDAEVTRLRSSSESIHGLINFLKSEFRFKRDPYTAWYVIKGERRTASYGKLMDVKDRRNALIHGDPSAEEDVTLDDYEDARLAMRAVAHTIAMSVLFEHYHLAESAGQPPSSG